MPACTARRRCRRSRTRRGQAQHAERDPQARLDVTGSARLLVALDGSPHEGSSVHRLVAAACAGAHDAGAMAEHVRAYALAIKPCVACGPDATPGYCIFHDDMDRL